MEWPRRQRLGPYPRVTEDWENVRILHSLGVTDDPSAFPMPVCIYTIYSRTTKFANFLLDLKFS